MHMMSFNIAAIVMPAVKPLPSTYPTMKKYSSKKGTETTATKECNETEIWSKFWYPLPMNYWILHYLNMWILMLFWKHHVSRSCSWAGYQNTINGKGLYGTALKTLRSHQEEQSRHPGSIYDFQVESKNEIQESMESYITTFSHPFSGRFVLEQDQPWKNQYDQI